MKICLVGPGIMPIPPNGWGAVEMLIYDYAVILKELGNQVDIVNTRNRKDIVFSVNCGDYDVVHVHYDVFVDIMPHLKAKVKIFSSHYPFISYPQQYEQDGYSRLIRNIADNKDFHIFASSTNDIETFARYGADRQKMFRSKLGVRIEPYQYYNNSQYDRTLCFSQISGRKRQYLIQHFDNIDFMGRNNDPRFINLKNYKGEVAREFLNQEISKYGNFVLLSLVENTTPLAVKEALICGLGVVVTEPVAYELDHSLDFITVIPECRINDQEYLRSEIQKNKEVSMGKRQEIRDYGIREFGLENILQNQYMTKIKSILNE